MSVLVTAVGAQVEAEVKARLRSPATVVAFGALLVASYFWIPDPQGRVSSLSWEGADGVTRAPLYNSAYLGIATALLSGIFLVMASFYFVAGSVRKDRETGIGAILAATPLPSGAYLLGKWAANAAYILVLACLALPVGFYAFFRFGEGPFEPLRLAGPLLLNVLPAASFVAATALLFDVTPGLKGQGGLVVGFFASMFVLIALPAQLAGGFEGKEGRLRRQPLFDPAGSMTMNLWIQQSLPEVPKSVSTGLIFHDKPMQRVRWNGFPFTFRMALLRLSSLVWTLPMLGLALLFFDRFDPARGRLRMGRGAKAAEARVEASSVPVPALALSQLRSVAPHPSAWLSVLAEARLIWDTASFLKWPLAASALVGAFLPAAGSAGVTAAFLVLLVPVISEVAAREEIAGTRSLVFAQPGVPKSAVLWKLASVSVFLAAVASPLLLRALLQAATAPIRLFALATGLLFVAAFAVSAGWLTGGGKLFSGVYVALWYTAVNRVPAFDVTGSFAPTTAPVHLTYAAIGAALVGIALGIEKKRAAA
ncbi:MAG TPA: hypothetical protein VGR00_05100 [Thermoanaerobaculia bacterium]|nr:hypothetical protein [Thermoanaerobaculia bacterium]